MNNLLERNIYDFKGKVLISGTCLPIMQKEGFNKLIEEYDEVVYLCLEKNTLIW